MTKRGGKFYILQNMPDIQSEKGVVSINIVGDDGVLFGGG